MQYLDDIITRDDPFQGQRGRELMKRFQLLNSERIMQCCLKWPQTVKYEKNKIGIIYGYP